uniref:Uncharacterized protein n=1 Tax=Rhinolophus ferrumequinum TaxID=59479 RepID=A0A671DQE3_RHIFE
MGSRPSNSACPPFLQRKETTGRICRLSRSRKKSLLTSHKWSSPGEVALQCLMSKDRLHYNSTINGEVGLTSHSDQRLRPQRTEQYVLLSILLFSWHLVNWFSSCFFIQSLWMMRASR